MERRAARRQDPIGTGQGVDADPFFECSVWPNRFNDDDALLQSRKNLGVKCSRAAAVAEPDAGAIDNRET